MRDIFYNERTKNRNWQAHILPYTAPNVAKTFDTPESLASQREKYVNVFESTISKSHYRQLVCNLHSRSLQMLSSQVGGDGKHQRDQGREKLSRLRYTLPCLSDYEEFHVAILPSRLGPRNAVEGTPQVTDIQWIIAISSWRWWLNHTPAIWGCVGVNMDKFIRTIRIAPVR